MSEPMAMIFGVVSRLWWFSHPGVVPINKLQKTQPGDLWVGSQVLSTASAALRLELPDDGVHPHVPWPVRTWINSPLSISSVLQGSVVWLIPSSHFLLGCQLTLIRPSIFTFCCWCLGFTCVFSYFSSIRGPFLLPNSLPGWLVWSRFSWHTSGVTLCRAGNRFGAPWWRFSSQRPQWCLGKINCPLVI